MLEILDQKKFFLKNLIFVNILLSSYLIYTILSLSNSGFDITDEGMYLNWISNPHIYKTSISHFGFLYNPIYNFLDGDIANLRKFNFLFNLTLSYSLVYLLIKKIDKSFLYNHLQIQILIIGISLFICFYRKYLTTPAVNTNTNTPLSRINALSFQASPTNNQPPVPTRLRTMS